MREAERLTESGQIRLTFYYRTCEIFDSAKNVRFALKKIIPRQYREIHAVLCSLFFLYREGARRRRHSSGKGRRAMPSVRHWRSVFHASHDEHRIVLFRAALDRRHRSSWRNGKRRLRRVGRRARTTNRRRCIARGAAGQMRHVIERRALIELPAPVAISVGGMNGQHRRHVAGARDQVFAGRERKGRLLHDQAVFLQPPVRIVEFPSRRGDATGILQPLIAVQLDAPRTRVQRPQTPRLRAALGGRTWIAQRRDELRRYARELRLTSACGVNRLSHGGDHYQ